MINKEAIQKHCNALEELLDRDSVSQKLSFKDFQTINLLLLELQIAGLHKPELD